MTGKEVAEEEKLLNYEASEEKPEVVKEPHSEEEKATWENLPHKKQLLLIALCRLSTPLSNACLLPYLYFLVKSILSDPEHPEAPQKISRLTGLLVAAYPSGQMATSMLWGHLSDTYGRKPAILIGLFISVTANLAFGFSRTIGMLLFWRVLAGMANGILGVMRTMTAEIVKEKKFQSRAFLAPPLIFNSGRVIALAVGGCLADPVDNLPSLFGPNGWFNVSNNPAGVEWTLKYPYALPALFNGTVLGFCLLAATLWLRESLPSKEHNWDMGLVIGDYISRFFGRIVLRNRNRAGYTPARMEEEEGLISDFPATQNPRSGVLTPTTTPKAEPYKPPFRDIWTRRLLKVLLVFALFPLHNATFLHIFPVYLSLPGSSNAHPTAFHFSGGLGLASPTVGLYLATFGICGILLQLFLYPRVQRRIGTLGVLRLASCIFPIVYIAAPYLSLLAGNETWKWVGMAAVLFCQVMARTMAIPSNVILLTDAAPRRSVLGTIHGAGNMLSALASACGPVIGGALLARGIEIGSVGLVWWSWLFVAALLTLGCSFLVEGAKDGEDGRCEVGGE